MHTKGSGTMRLVTDGPAIGRVVCVRVGRPRSVQAGRRMVTTAIWKEPVSGRVAVRGVNVDGDDQADRQAHGGVDKAVYAYAKEDYDWWAIELGTPLEPGAMGENLTLAGVDVTAAVVGERWSIGSAELEVCQPRMPCGKLGIRVGDPHFPARFRAAGRPGAYLRIRGEGELAAGDEVLVSHRPDHGLTVGEVARSQRDETLLPRLLLAPELAESWRVWAAEHLAAPS